MKLEKKKCENSKAHGRLYVLDVEKKTQLCMHDQCPKFGFSVPKIGLWWKIYLSWVHYPITKMWRDII